MPRYAINVSDLEYIRETNLITMIRKHYPLVLNWVQDLPFKEKIKEDEGERDLAGKLPFAKKMMQLGLERHCIVDPSNSGGILKYAKASPDALFIERDQDISKYISSGKGKLIEIKGAIKSAKGNTYDFKFRENGFKNEEITTVVFILRNMNPGKNTLRSSWLDMDMNTIDDMFVAMIPMKTLHDLIRRHFKRAGPWRFSLPRECIPPPDSKNKLSIAICQKCTFKGYFWQLTVNRLQTSPLNLLPHRIEQLAQSPYPIVSVDSPLKNTNPAHWWRRRKLKKRKCAGSTETNSRAGKHK